MFRCISLQWYEILIMLMTHKNGHLNAFDLYRFPTQTSKRAYHDAGYAV